jgi:purine-binding chemotaxis protein CheW
MEDYEEIEIDLEDEEHLEDKYITVEIADKRFAINIEYVREIVTLPDVRDVPNAKANERGIIKVRGELIHVIDMRKSLGFESLEEEDSKLLSKINLVKEQHEEWLEELISSIKDNREFKKTTDPHQCQFGKWYDKYETNDINLSLYLSYFDKPHKNIHALAKKAKKTQNEKGVDAALELIDEVKDTDFKEIINLFEGFAQPLKESHREVVVIIDKDGDLQGISVDAVDKIINIPHNSIEKKGELKKNRFVKGVSDIEGSPVIILDYNVIIE